MFTFPGSELDQPQALLNLLGSFWARAYQGSDLVSQTLYARAQLAAQTYLDMFELIASMSRFTVPVFHTDNWYALTLKESQLNAATLAKFDGTYAFDAGLFFDTPVNSVSFAWPAPAGLVTAKTIMERIGNASVCWTDGIDFTLADAQILFRVNPFTQPGVLVREIFAANEVVDRECVLWVYRGQWDWQTVWNQFGYVLGIYLESSENYKQLVNAVFDSLIVGSTGLSLSQLLGAVCDVPVARENETVQTITQDARKLWVITDKNAYGFDSASNVQVIVGQTLRAGDLLTDAITLLDFNRGQVPSDAVLPALSVGRGFLASGYLQDIIFENKTVPLSVVEAVDTDDGFTRVSFEVWGFPSDVTKFWQDVHAAGVIENQTLAMLLDQRTTKTGQPTSLALPSTVNPLAFLLQNLFRDNLIVVRLKPAVFGPNALSLDNLRVLRRLLPPHTACIVYVQLATSDMLDMVDVGSADAAGYVENVQTFRAGSQSDSVSALDFVTERVTLKQIAGRCEG